MKVTVIGSGYVGLVTAACLADVGNTVLCVDIDAGKVEGLKRGVIPIYEPGLKELVVKNIESKRLDFTTDVALGVRHGKIQILAVGTPPRADGSANLNYVQEAVSSIARYMEEPKILVNKSTVPVGTGDLVRSWVQTELKNRSRTDLTFDVISNPEFLKEGAAIDDFTRPDRIIIGGDRSEPLEIMRRLYQPFQRNHDKTIVMDIRSAELTKYAANAMLATRISFMNEMAFLAEKMGADIEKVRVGLGSDPRIGYEFLYSGLGYGGSCFPKDVSALHALGKTQGLPMACLEAVQSTNEQARSHFFDKIEKHFQGQLRGRTFAVWGLAFKPNTDDMREAPSLFVIRKLLEAGAHVRAFDPVAMTEAKKYFEAHPSLSYGTDLEEVARGSEALVILTEWKQFRSPDLIKLGVRLVFDGRNLFDPQEMKNLGIKYYAVGRGESIA